MKIPLSRPDITQKEINKVVGVLKTPYLSRGPKQDEFQNKFAAYVGSKYAVATSSGTNALHLLMKSYGIGKGDEVITSPFSFIASSNCILFNQATPVFVDIEHKIFNIDVDKIEERITAKTRAILVVHIFGMPADMKKINRIARKHNLIVIEDACEALGAEINGKKVGSFSDAAVFAFYPNKQITTGEGGMIVTSNKHIKDLCNSLKNQGRELTGKDLGFLRLGYSYRISDINCALGIAQLERIDDILKRRERVAQVYNERLQNVEGLQLLCEKKGFKRSWFVYMIKLSERFSSKERDRIVESLAEKGIACGKYFPAIHLETFYKEMFGFKNGDYPVTEATAERMIAVPFHNKLTHKEINFVCKEVKKLVSNKVPG
jgi:perosamine synthetase